MSADLLFTAASLTLLVYWFRYTCMLILSVRSTGDRAAAVAQANALQFPEIQQKLANDIPAEPAHLDLLRRSLERDYDLLISLIRNGAEFRIARQQLENRMLMLDFQIMRAWFSVSRRLSVQRGRQTLEEMIHILGHFADMMAECTATASK